MKVHLHPEVAAALRNGRAVVALESSVLAQGLPDPSNREADRRMCAAIRERGAVPAVTAVVRGVPVAGLDDADLPLGQSQGSVLLHIYEELTQHLGQMELTRDLLLAG